MHKISHNIQHSLFGKKIYLKVITRTCSTEFTAEMRSASVVSHVLPYIASHHIPANTFLYHILGNILVTSVSKFPDVLIFYMPCFPHSSTISTNRILSFCYTRNVSIYLQIQHNNGQDSDRLQYYKEIRQTDGGKGYGKNRKRAYFRTSLQ